MDLAGYREYLEKREIPEALINSHISVVERFDGYIRQSDERGWDKPATARDFEMFSELLILDEQNTYDNYLALIRYAYFAKNDEVYLAVLKLLDGAEALDNLYQRLAESIGEDKRDWVFRGEQPLPLGASSEKKAQVMRQIMERFEQIVEQERCEEILGDGLRDLQDEWYRDAREKFLESDTLDAFIAWKGDDFIAQLEKIMLEDSFFFNQKINQEVIDFVDSHPEIRQGVREGNILYEAKIPYMAIEYLNTTDHQMKPYYYCHCPWARESLIGDNIPVSGTFCNCSAGYHKKYWEMVLDQPLKAEVLESVLQGDDWCLFSIHLPDDLEEI